MDILEPFFQTRQFLGQMPHAAAQLEPRLLMLAVQPAQTRHLGIDAGLFDHHRVA